jgi:hypothetical protein
VVIIVGIRVMHDKAVMIQRLVIGIRVGGKNVKTFFRFNVECGRLSVFGGNFLGPILLYSLLLPLEDASPILCFLLVKFVFPLGFRFLAIGADVTPFMTTRAVAAFDIVIQLPLGFGRDFVAIDDRIKVGSFQTVR